MGPAIEGEGGAVTLGRDRFATAFRLAVGAWLGCVLLQLLLYARPAPAGGPFLVEWQRYFGLAVYYDLLGVWLVSLPFFLLWLAFYQRPLRSRLWRAVPPVQAALLTANLALSQIDHEVLRFLGVRLNLSFLVAYAQPQMLGDALFLDLLRTDRGGAWLPMALLAVVPALYLALSARLLRRPPRRTFALWAAILLALVPAAAPANGWQMATSEFRLRKVEPVLIAFATDLAAGFEDLETPAEYAAMVAEYRRDWLARSTDPNWRFDDAEQPFVRTPVGSPPTLEPWNVIYLQLETLRGVDTGFLRLGAGRSPTPYLDSLARRPDAAVWTRALSFGMPSINGVFAVHCSIMPPSQRYITALTHVALHCLPERLRALGYRTEMFNGGDTDWDNSSPWLRRWYDRLWRFPDADGRDRDVFRAAADGIRRLGRSRRPFFATVVSVTNHTPFTSREPELDIAGRERPAERILNTTHYTDDVVREFVESLRGEPWFERTLIVIAGDHGFNVGEHGQVPGQHNLYRESVWVPLIVAGAHPRLPAGIHDQPATLLDVAPTLADLLGLRERNPWQGHSLLAVNGRGWTGFGFRNSLLAETPAWSAVRDPRDGRARLFRREDWLQRRDLSSSHPGLGERLLGAAERRRRLNDYLLRQGRVWRSNAS